MELHWPNKLDEASFLQQYWQTRPLLIKRAFPALAEAENPISRDELGGLAMEQDVNSRIILRENDTKWHCRHGPFQSEDLEALPAQDWSLLVSDIEKHLPEMRAWIKPFHFIPQWRIDDLMISYAPKGASVGAHIDNYDVFLLQAAGTRQWSITENPEADRSLIPDLDIGVLANFEAENTWVLEPGDMLYLPPGTPHHGISLDDNCMTWSVGFRAPSHREIVTEIAERLAAEIPEEAFYSDPGILLHEHSGQISPNVVTRLREIWNTYVHPDSEEFEQLVGQVLTNRNDAEVPSVPPLSTRNEATPGSSNLAATSTAADNPGEPENNSDIERERLKKLLDLNESWERDSFASFAFVLESRFADQEEKPTAKVLTRIKETVSRASAESDASSETNTGTSHSRDLSDTHATKKQLPVKLYVNGSAVECSEHLAGVVTAEFAYDVSTLLDACTDEQDCAALVWLVENRFIQSL